MFADSLLDSAWSDRSRRGYTTLIAFATQTLGVGLLLSLPLLYIQGLPHIQWMSTIAAPAPAPPPAEPAPTHPVHPSTSNLSATGQVIAPQFVPRDIAEIHDVAPPSPVDISGLQVQGGTGEAGARNAVFDSIGSGLRSVLPPPPPPPSRPQPLISHMMEGNLIFRVQPVYPPLARQARVQGTVLLRAIISREGRIENLQVISGHPLLVQAAIDAVSRWRYRPCYLNGEPVEVETEVTVNFTLTGG